MINIKSLIEDDYVVFKLISVFCFLIAILAFFSCGLFNVEKTASETAGFIMIAIGLCMNSIAEIVKYKLGSVSSSATIDCEAIKKHIKSSFPSLNEENTEIVYNYVCGCFMKYHTECTSEAIEFYVNRAVTKEISPDEY